MCVEEVSGQELCVTWTQQDSLQWTFEVSTSVSQSALSEGRASVITAPPPASPGSQSPALSGPV